MKQLYKLSQEFESNGFVSANTVYIILRTLAVFLPSLIVGFLLKDLIHLPATTPATFVIMFCGWITVIFGFWGALLYLMRQD